MTPGQISVIADVHRIANDPDAPPLEAEGGNTGGVVDLIAFASMTRL